MKKFIIKLFVFIIVCIASDIGIGRLFKLYDFIYDGQEGKIHSIMTTESPEILILGSSRAAHHYIPSILQDSLNLTAYNAGISGEGTTVSYGLLKGIEKRTIPKIILCEITPIFDIYSYRDASLNNFYPYIGQKEIRNLIVDFDPSENIKLCSNAYRLNSKIFVLFYSYISGEKEISKGFEALLGKINTSKRHKKIIHELQDSVEFQINDKKEFYFRKLIEDAEEHGIHIYFLISPIFKGGNLSYYKKELDIIRKYNIPLLNHMNDQRIINNPDYFQDETHLNKEGATAYTKIIVEELKLNEKKNIIATSNE